MVKIAPAMISKSLQSLDKNYIAALIYGPDEGLVRERADALSKQISPDLTDAFNVVRPEISDVLENTSILADELSSLSMLGDRRLIRVDGLSDKGAKSCEYALDVKSSDNLLVITAGALAPTSKLRKLFESAPNAAVIACYADEARDIEALIFKMLSSHGLRAESQAISYLLSVLGNDRLVTRGEIEKLILYKGSNDNTPITLTEAKAIIGDNSNLTLSEIANSVASGMPQKLDGLLDKAITQGENPIAILRVLQSHLQQLYFVKGLVDEGIPIETALGKLPMRLFFKQKDQFKAQVFKWTTGHLVQALDMCQQAEIQCKTTGLPDQAICARTCLSLSVKASQSR